MDARELLDLYSRHFEEPHRRPDTAVSLESLQWLNLHGLPEVRERLGVIENLADLGSGISSAFFRLWMIRDQIVPGRVWSVDTDRPWLQRSAFETGVLLRDVELEDGWESVLPGEWLELEEFLEGIADGTVERESFQVVFLDTAKAGRRKYLLHACNELLVPGGLLILDDWHMEHHRIPSEALLGEAGYEIEDYALETLDDFGRYLAVAWKPETGAEVPELED